MSYDATRTFDAARRVNAALNQAMVELSFALQDQTVNPVEILNVSSGIMQAVLDQMNEAAVTAGAPGTEQQSQEHPQEPQEDLGERQETRTITPFPSKAVDTLDDTE